MIDAKIVGQAIRNLKRRPFTRGLFLGLLVGTFVGLILGGWVTLWKLGLLG